MNIISVFGSGDMLTADRQTDVLIRILCHCFRGQSDNRYFSV